jgi:acyl-CoA thioester hydrolase
MTEPSVGPPVSRTIVDVTDPMRFTLRWPVRTYEVDENGHVNNAVYVQWAEYLAAQHAEACGWGRRWSTEQGGAWLVRRHEIVYHLPALREDEVELTVEVLRIGGVRGIRHTRIHRTADRALLAEVQSEWVWVRLSDGRPDRVPQIILDAYREAMAGG